jgi:hypothetical protein
MELAWEVIVPRCAKMFKLETIHTELDWPGHNSTSACSMVKWHPCLTKTTGTSLVKGYPTFFQQAGTSTKGDL